MAVQVKLNYEPVIRKIPYFSALAFTSHTCAHTKCFALVMKRGKQWLVNSCLGASYPEVLWVNEQSLVEGRGGQGGKGQRALHGRKAFMVFPGILGMRPSPLPNPRVETEDLVLNMPMGFAGSNSSKSSIFSLLTHQIISRGLWHCDCWDSDTNYSLVSHSFCLNLGFSCSPPWPDW